MKSLTEYINETLRVSSQMNEKALTAFDSPTYFFDGSAGEYYKKIGYKYYNDMNRPTKEELEKAYGTTSNVTGDPSFANVDGVEFTKIKKDEWQSSSQLKHVFGGIVSNKTLYQMMDNSKKPFYFMLRFTEAQNKK